MEVNFNKFPPNQRANSLWAISEFSVNHAGGRRFKNFLSVCVRRVSVCGWLMRGRRRRRVVEDHYCHLVIESQSFHLMAESEERRLRFWTDSR